MILGERAAVKDSLCHDIDKIRIGILRGWNFPYPENPHGTVRPPFLKDHFLRSTGEHSQHLLHLERVSRLLLVVNFLFILILTVCAVYTLLPRALGMNKLLRKKS